MRLEERLIEALRSRGQTLALAESCTGGLLGHRLTNVAGSSAVFLGAIVPYHNRVKQGILGVPEDILAGPGAVSAEGAGAMARGVRQLMGADYGLAISGIAGPSGGARDKPAGTVHIAVATADGIANEERHFPGERITYKLQATDAAIHMLLAATGSGEADGDLTPRESSAEEQNDWPPFRPAQQYARRPSGPRQQSNWQPSRPRQQSDWRPPRPTGRGPASSGPARERRPQFGDRTEAARARSEPRFSSDRERTNAGPRPPASGRGREGFGPFRGPEPRDRRSGNRSDFQPSGRGVPGPRDNRGYRPDYGDNRAAGRPPGTSNRSGPRPPGRPRPNGRPRRGE